MVGSASLNSDGFASYTTWNATCFNADGNTVLNGDPCVQRRARSTPDNFTGPYSLQQSLPRRRCSHVHDSPSGLANNLGNT